MTSSCQPGRKKGWPWDGGEATCSASAGWCEQCLCRHWLCASGKLAKYLSLNVFVLKEVCQIAGSHFLKSGTKQGLAQMGSLRSLEEGMESASVTIYVTTSSCAYRLSSSLPLSPGTSWAVITSTTPGDAKASEASMELERKQNHSV